MSYVAESNEYTAKALRKEYKLQCKVTQKGRFIQRKEPKYIKNVAKNDFLHKK